MPKPQDILSDRYQLLKPLGNNMGRQTWLAKDFANNDELVVLKLLTFGGDVQWDDLKLFEREAQVLKQLNHPAIPTYRDYFTIDDRSLWFGLVQEYIPGKSLKELLTEGHKFTEDRVYEILNDLLEILIYLHELNPPVLHRDIKPSNLIWSDREEIYLVDFGAVQDKAAAEGRTFTVVGTYGYAPLEQYGGRAVAASDLYGLGATAIHLLTGISPAELPQDRDLNIQFSDRTGANSQLVQWLQKMTAPSLHRRYTSAREALDALYDEAQETLLPPKGNASQVKVPRPLTIEVKIERSPSILRIIIPPSLSSKFLTLFFSVTILITIGTLFWQALISGDSMIPIMAIITILVILAVCKLFSRVWLTLSITFDHGKGKCEITQRIFNWFHQWQKFAIADIEYIHPSMANRVKGSIAIQTHRQKYLFGNDRLSELEAAWLVQEIQEWLTRPEQGN
jgi:serine/threonine protein kinase